MKRIVIAIFYVLVVVYARADEHGHQHATNESHAEDNRKETKHADQDNHEHDHEESDEHKAVSDSHTHDDHEEEEHESEHTHDEDEEEESPVVGPDKGILEKSTEGFKLAAEAIQTFELKIENLKSSITQITRKSLVEIKNDKFIYRVRNDWIQKIPVKVLKKDSQQITIEISQFKNGDQIITNGVGFVRTAELVAEEGVSHGHSH